MYLLYYIKGKWKIRQEYTKNKKNTYPLDSQIIETSANITFFLKK